MKSSAIISSLAMVLTGCAHGPGITHSPIPMPTYATSVRIDALKEEKTSDVVALPNAYPMPVFPPDFERAGVGGTVDLRFIVGADGAVRELRVARSSHPQFEASALRAVSQWKFVLRAVSGPLPEKVPMTATIVFSAVRQEPKQSPEPMPLKRHGSP